MSYVFPAQSTGVDTREFLHKIWTNESAMPMQAPRFFYESGMSAIKRVAPIQGTSRQFQLLSEGTAPFMQSAGDDISGQVAGRVEGLITRQEAWLGAAHGITYNEMLVVPSAIAKLEYYTKLRNENIWGQLDRWLGQCVILQARQTSAVTSQGQFVHAGGTRTTRSSGASTNSQTAVETVYPRNSTGGTNAYNDLAAHADALDKKGIPRTPGARPVVLHTQFRNALLEFNDARLFSKDYIDMNLGNNVQRRMIDMVLGFTIIGDTQYASLNGAGNSIHGGRLPGKDYLTDTMTNARGKFQPESGNTSVGAPVLVGACDVGSDVGVVEYWEDQGLTSYTEDNERRKSMLFHSYLLPQMGAGNPAGAHAIEVTY